MGLGLRQVPWTVVLGAAGIGCLVAGAFAAGTPPAVDATTATWIAYLSDHRGAVLAGAALTTAAGVLLLAPFAHLSALVRRSGRDTAATFGLATWVVAFMFLIVGSMAVAAVAWRGPAELDMSVVRFAVDISNLATWGLSATVAGIAVLAMTLPAWRAGLVSRWVAGLAVAKSVTCVVEVAGLGLRHGWDAGGYGAATSAAALVAWAVAVLWALHSMMVP